MSEMFAALMRGAQVTASRQPRRPAPSAPNYEALVEVLTGLYQIPDGLGETFLNKEEATAIRKCGFVARANTIWRCPILPRALVEWNPLLRHLSDGIHPLDRPAGWKPKRAAAAPYNCVGYAITKYENRLYRTLLDAPGQCLRKRELQHKNWRMHARFFNHVLNSLIQRGSFTVVEGWIYPYDREKMAALYNGFQAAQQRR